MATTVISIPNTWTKIAENSENEISVSWTDSRKVEFASTLADSEPAIAGHKLSREAGVSRKMLGAGYLWAKSVPEGSTAPVELTISKSSEPVITPTSGVVYQKYVRGTDKASHLAQYDFEIDTPDILTRTVTSNGQIAIALSVDPLTEDGHCELLLKKTCTIPQYFETELSLSQRVKGAYTMLDIYKDPPTGNNSDGSPATIAIVQACQSNTSFAYSGSPTAGTILNLRLASPFTGLLGDWINVYGFADSRLNYANLCVAGVSMDRLDIYCSVADEATIPSLAIGTVTPTANTAFIQVRDMMHGASDGYSMRFSGTSATAAAYATRFANGDVQMSGTVTGTQTVTSGTTAAVFTGGGGFGIPEVRATTRYLFEARPSFVYFGDFPVDNTSGSYSTRARRTGVKPNWGTTLQPRLRMTRPKSMSRPVARITSVVRASNVVTVTTGAAHGLVNGNVVNIKGVYNNVLFSNTSSGLTVTVTGANTFTIAWTGTDGTSYGGAVCLVNGGVDQPGLIAQTIQQVSTNTSLKLITLTGSAAWTGLNIGEYVNIYGVSDASTGADLNIDGAYVINDWSGTTLVLTQITDAFGVLRSPAIPSLNAVNCSGAVIMRTTARTFDMTLESVVDHEVTLSGQGTNDQARAMPATLVGSSNGVNTTEVGVLAASSYSLTTAASTNAAVVKSTAANLYELSITNTSAAAIYVKLYNRTTAPTPGTDIPVLIITVPANSEKCLEFGRLGKRFTPGLAIATTASQVNSDTTAIAAGCYIHGSYV